MEKLPVNITPELHQEVSDKINQFRFEVLNMPALKDSSLKVHIRNYNLMSGHMEAKDDDDIYFLVKKDQVFSKLKTVETRTGLLSAPTRRNYLTALLIFLQVTKQDPHLIQSYQHEILLINSEERKKLGQLKYSEKEKENGIPTSQEITDALKALEQGEHLKYWHENLVNDVVIDNKAQYDEIAYWVTMKVYEFNRLRNDVASCFMIREEYYNKLSEKSREHNFLVMKEDCQWYFRFQDWKTKNEIEKFRDVAVAGGIEVNFMLSRWFITTNHGRKQYPFIINYKSKLRLTSKQFTDFMLKNNKKYLGYQIGTRALRKIYYSDKYAHIAEQLVQDQHSNLHSVGTIMESYTKVI